MPARLREPQTRVTWRIEARDHELLLAVFGERGVNGAVREILHRYCEAVRGKLGDKSPPPR